MRTLPVRRLVLAIIGSVALVATSSPFAVADVTQPPVVTSVDYGYYTSPVASYQADTVNIDWGSVTPDLRVYGRSNGGATNFGVFYSNVTSIYKDSGTPRTRISYRAGACATDCNTGGMSSVTWSAWFHPTIAPSVHAGAPGLTATSGTKASPGVKVTVKPGAQAGAPAYLIFNAGVPIGRVGPDNLTFVDASPNRPQNSYQVEACYADCDYPNFAWGDGYTPISARSAVVKAWTANTATCQSFGTMLFNLGLNWRNACKP